MSLETATYISDLVSTNPVGATDFVNQGDDHIRLLKAVLQAQFPNLGAAAVTYTAAQLNDAGRKSAAQTVSAVWTFSAIPVLSAGLNVSGGTVALPAASIADAALSANVPLKNAANAFTAAQTATVGDNSVALVAAASSGQIRLHGYHASFSGAFMQVRNGDNSAAVPLTVTASAFSVLPSNGGWAMAANGVMTVEAAVVAATTFTVKGNTSDNRAIEAFDNTGVYAIYLRPNAGGNNVISSNYVGGSYLPLCLTARETATDFAIGTDGNIAMGGNLAVTGSIKGKIATSTSTTLAKHQLHQITGAATLPALDDGEWVALLNASGSAITITEHSGDTTYWNGLGGEVSTVGLSARGMLFAVGKGSGVVHIISGDIEAYT